MLYSSLVVLALSSTTLSSPLFPDGAGRSLSSSTRDVLEHLAARSPLNWQPLGDDAAAGRTLTLRTADWAAAKAIVQSKSTKTKRAASADGAFAASDSLPSQSTSIPSPSASASPPPPSLDVPTADTSSPPPNMDAPASPPAPPPEVHWSVKCYGSGSWAYTSTLTDLVPKICGDDGAGLNFDLPHGMTQTLQYPHLRNEANDEMTVDVTFHRTGDPGTVLFDPVACRVWVQSLVDRQCVGKHQDTRGGVLTVKDAQNKEAFTLSVDPQTLNCNC